MTESRWQAGTIVDVLNYRAEETPHKIAYRFISNEETDEITYLQLKNNAMATAQQLLISIPSFSSERPRVVILCKPGISYLNAFFGCLAANMIAVPLYPPRRESDVQRLISILQNATADLILLDEDIATRTKKLLQQNEILKKIKMMVVTKQYAETKDKLKLPTLKDIAFLQYTSGSTGAPKGVMVSHENLMTNCAAIQSIYKMSSEIVGIIWLPPYHDMGLIGGIIQNLFVGSEDVLMSPFYFLQKPIRWLNAISKYRGFLSGGNDFGFVFCTENISIEDCEKTQLDLSSWKVAFIGAEMIHDSTIQQFTAKFAPFGFKPETFLPAYGLAEATLMVTSCRRDKTPIIQSFDPKQLVLGKVKPSHKKNSRKLVSCGYVIPHHKLVIVNPDTQQPCEDNAIGEIWFAGKSVTQGYWKNPTETEKTFNAVLNGKKYLRTGDLGFMYDGNLYFAGRIKNLIIIRGRNFYASDLEYLASESHPAIMPGRTAAFAIDVDDQENLVLVCEAKRHKIRKYSGEEVINAIRTDLAEIYGIQPFAVVLIREGTIPKTSSGKVKRFACREEYLEKKLVVLFMGERDQPIKSLIKNPKPVFTDSRKTDEMLVWLRNYANTRINSRLFDERRCIPPYIFMDLAAKGFMGLFAPEKYGGLNLSFKDTARIIEQFGAIDVSLGIIIGYQNALGVRPILQYGSQENIEKWIPSLVSGQQFCAFALTEPIVGANTGLSQTFAVPKDQGWILNGIKRWNISGWANLMHVYAEIRDGSNKAQPTMFLIQRDMPGVSTGPEALTMGFRGILQSALTLENVYVDASSVIGQVGQGQEIIDNILNISRLGIGILGFGAMKRSAQLIHRYGSRRRIYTGKLIDNPIILDKVSVLTAEITAHEVLIRSISELIDAGHATPSEISMIIKISATEAAWKATDLLMQLLGGRGYMENNYAPQLLRDVRALRIIEGPTESLGIFVGRSLMQTKNIQNFLAEYFQAENIANQITQYAEEIYKFNLKNSPSQTHAMLKTHSIAGFLAIKGLLLAAVNMEVHKNSKVSNEKAKMYCLLDLEQYAKQCLADNPDRVALQTRKEIADLIEGYRATIGDIEQNCPGEDIERDPLLQLHPVPAKAEIKTPDQNQRIFSKSKKISIEELKAWIQEWMQVNCKTNEKIDENTSLFAYGLDSILVVRLTNDVQNYIQQPIDQTALWEYTTLEDLSKYIVNEVLSKGKEIEKEISHLPSAPPDYNNVSLEQERLWVAAQLHKSTNNNMLRAFDIKGPLNLKLFEESLNILLQTHEVLRASFPLQQKVTLQINDYQLKLAIKEYLTSSPKEKKSIIENACTDLLNHQFVLDQPPLFRFLLIKFDEDEYTFIVVFHHIISDIITFKLFLEKLVEIYDAKLKGKTIDFSESTKYLDYVYWQRQQEKTPEKDKLKQFWLDLLGDAPKELQLPLDYARSTMAKYEGKYELVSFDKEKIQAIKTYAASHGTTIFAFLFTMFNVLLYLFSKQTDLVIGIPSSGRYHPALENLMGFLAYPLPYRTKINPQQELVELIQQINKTNIAVMKHGTITLSEINMLIKPARDINYNPIFQVMFGYIANQLEPKIVEATEFIPNIDNSRAPGEFDIFLSLFEHADGAAGAFMYNSLLFNTETIKLLVNSYINIISQALIHPDIKINEFKLSDFLSDTKIEKYAINVASTFVAEPLNDYFEFWMKKLDISTRVNFAPFNQVFQQLIDPDSLIFKNQKGCNIICVRLIDWLQQKKKANKTHILGIIDEFIILLKNAISRSNAPLVICVAPVNSDLITSSNYAQLIKICENELINRLHAIKSIHLLTEKEIQGLYPLQNAEAEDLVKAGSIAATDSIFDPLTDEVASIPYNERFYCAMATTLTRYIYSLNSLPKKVILLDCDQTLWKGVCGEDPLNKIQIPYPFRVLQFFLVELQAKGKILCLCSKNSEDDVFRVLDHHPQMILKREHITAYKINWNSKTENILALAEELDLGLDSFVLLDDNPIECAEVRANLPQVTTLSLPENINEILSFLRNVWDFDVWEVSEEDKLRTLFYKTDVKRKSLLKQSPSIQEFIESLKLKVEITPLSEKRINRASQLYLRTNQFNANPLRRRAADIHKLQREGEHFVTISAQDRFGDYGIIGIMAYQMTSDKLLVDTFILSCRVLGRGIERQMLIYLAEQAKNYNTSKVGILFSKTDKNLPVEIFFEKIIQEKNSGTFNANEFEFKAADYQNLSIIPLSEHEMQKKSKKTRSLADKQKMLANISETATLVALKYNSVGKILAAAHPEQISKTLAPVQIESEIENELKNIFISVLELPDVDLQADFFRLGGSSFKAVLTIKKISDTFAAELSYFEFANAGSIQNLAKLIQNNQTQRPESIPQFNYLNDLYLYWSSELPSTASKTFSTYPQNILLTGATGYLGAYLLNDLLTHTNAQIFCLVREKNVEIAWKKLTANLKRYNLPTADTLSLRVELVLANAQSRRISFPDIEYEYLSSLIDAVYHCAALVNFNTSYLNLRNANVDLTRNMIDFCFNQRVKTLHFISSTAVFDSPIYGPNDIIQEKNLNKNESNIVGGYAQTKWVAEGLVTMAAEKGLPTVIYRPGAISPALNSNYYDEKNLLSQILYLCEKINAVPNVEGLADFAPVDYVSRSIVELAENPQAANKVFHLTHPYPQRIPVVVTELQNLNVKIDLIPYTEWLAKVLELSARSNDTSLAAFLPLLTEPAYEKGVTWIEMILNRPQFSCRQTLKLLKSEVKCSRVAELILKYREQQIKK